MKKKSSKVDLVRLPPKLQISSTLIMDQSIAELRHNYTRSQLSKADVDKNPIEQFKSWFEQALAAQLNEPNAMTIATSSLDGKPTARIVLLKEFDERGFVFYTNYKSLKGQQLTANPWAALVFWWAELERQVRIEGQVELVSEQESDRYFHSRPRDSQLGACVSPQSSVIDHRSLLEEKWQELNHKYNNREIPRPLHWGGFRVIPTQIEFWQGRPSRLHDRILYRRSDQQDTWIIERLSP